MSTTLEYGQIRESKCKQFDDKLIYAWNFYTLEVGSYILIMTHDMDFACLMMVA